MSDEESPPEIPPELQPLLEGIAKVDKMAGLAVHRPLSEGAGLAAAHAAHRYQRLQRSSWLIARMHGVESGAAQKIQALVDHQKVVGAYTVRAAASAASGLFSQSPAVLEMLGYSAEDFDRAGLAWPGGDDESPPEGSPPGGSPP